MGHAVTLTNDGTTLALGAMDVHTVYFYNLVMFYPPSTSVSPSQQTSTSPTSAPSPKPSLDRTSKPSSIPSISPSIITSPIPSLQRSPEPTVMPYLAPTMNPSISPNTQQSSSIQDPSANHESFIEAQASQLDYILDSSRTITVAGTELGCVVAFNSDGSKIIVSAEAAHNEDGQFYAYYDDGTTWTLYDDPGVAGKINTGDQFGKYVDVSADGNTVSTGSRTHGGTGYASVWFYNGTTWSQFGSDINGIGSDAYFGEVVKISDDGTRFVTGGANHKGTGGTAQVFTFNNVTMDWDQLGSDIQGESNKNRGDGLGRTSAMSGDGSTIAISANKNRRYITVMSYDESTSDWVMKGARFNLPSSTHKTFSLWLNHDGSKFAYGTHDTESNDGRVRVFDWDGSAWVQMGADVTPDNSVDRFGEG